MKPDKIYLISEFFLKIAGDCPEKALDGLKSYAAEGDFFGHKDVMRVSCSVAEHIPARELKPIYGVRHFIEEFGCFGGKFLSQDRAGDSSLATLTYDDDFHSVSCVLSDVEASGGSGLDSRMSIGESVVNCLPAFGGITYHASAIAYNGCALLFAAPSGTGKSTQARLWRESYPDAAVCINDDTPIIMKKDGVYRAYGSPWAGTSGENNNVSAPVKAVIYVERGTDNSVRPLVGQEKITRGLRSVRSQHFPVQMERQVKILLDFLDSVPVYELRCDISRGAVETVKSLLY